MILIRCCRCMCIFLFYVILLVGVCIIGMVIWSKISLGFLRLGYGGLCGLGRSLLSTAAGRALLSLIFWSLLYLVCLLMVISSIWMLASLGYWDYLVITLNVSKMLSSVLGNFEKYDISHSIMDQVISKLEHWQSHLHNNTKKMQIYTLYLDQQKET